MRKKMKLLNENWSAGVSRCGEDPNQNMNRGSSFVTAVLWLLLWPVSSRLSGQLIWCFGLPKCILCGFAGCFALLLMKNCCRVIVFVLVFCEALKANNTNQIILLIIKKKSSVCPAKPYYSFCCIPDYFTIQHEQCVDSRTAHCNTFGRLYIVGVQSNTICIQTTYQYDI